MNKKLSFQDTRCDKGLLPRVPFVPNSILNNKLTSQQVENETVAMDPDSVIEDIIREIDESEPSIQEFRETGAKLA